MGRIKINTNQIIGGDDARQARRAIGNAVDGVAFIRSTVDRKIRNRNGIENRFINLQNNLNSIQNEIHRINCIVEDCALKYTDAEERLVQRGRDIVWANSRISKSDAANKNARYFNETFEGNRAIRIEQEEGSKKTVNNWGTGDSDKFQDFTDEFWANYGWKEILAGTGYIGTIHEFVNDIKNAKTWRNLTETGIKAYQFLEGAAKTYNNYKKIGNAVGTKTAIAWWAKNVTGLKPLGRASTAQNPFTRFANNLTNKTSPFNAQFKNIINNFNGANGVGKAVASWGSVAVNGMLNWFSNKDEQASSNGIMSNGRVIAESITETAVDTVLAYGTGIVVGSAITAVFGTVAAPGLVVVAASGAIVAGTNAGVKALTGKNATEWISDGILDTGEAIGNVVWNNT